MGLSVTGRRWLALGVATLLAALAAAAVGLPASSLFAGLAFALIGPVRLVAPRVASVGAQPVIGTSLGAHVEPSTLASVGGHGASVSLVVAGTLGISLVAGLAVARLTGLDRATALLGLVAGGASGIVTMSRELGGDEDLVAVMQYLRVFVVVTLAPLVVAPALSNGGVQVGLRFTPAQLTSARRILPAVIAATAAIVAACAGLAALLASFADVPLLDAYVATTPGGMPAVLATAVGSGADTTFVLAVQTLRLLLMVVAAPPLVRLLAHGGRPMVACSPPVLRADGDGQEERA